MEGLEVFTMKDVSVHKTKEDCWFVIDGKVYDVTKFLEEHPGGEEVLIEASGSDATKDFDDIGHSQAARELMDNYLVGVLDSFKGDVTSNKKVQTAAPKNAPFKEIPASVIKDEEPAAFMKLLQFLVPLLIVGVAFGIRTFLKEPQPSQPSS